MKKLLFLCFITFCFAEQDIKELAKDLKTCHKTFETGEALKAGYAYCVRGVTYISLNNSLSVLKDKNNQLVLCKCETENE